ncbi:MAG: hypothetical protein V3U76_09025 [Granulosicoccus sp.]
MKFLIIIIVLAIAAWFLLRAQREKSRNLEQAQSGSDDDTPGAESTSNSVVAPRKDQADPRAAETASTQNTGSRESHDTEPDANNRAAAGAAAIAVAASAATLADKAPANPDLKGEHSSTDNARANERRANQGDTEQKSEYASAKSKMPTGTAANESSSQKSGTTTAAPAESGDSDFGAVVTKKHLQSSDTLHDVREMIKILNLRDSDASRLDISKSDFANVWSGDTGAVTADVLDSVAAKLRNMLR